MSSSKRQFDDFLNFGGKIERGIYCFPTLTKIDTHNNVRVWSVKVRLIEKKLPTELDRKYGMLNWIIDKSVPILPEYLSEGTLPKNVISQVWTENGVTTGIMTRHMPTYPKPTNVGRTNERNYLQQALVVARGLFLKQVERGGEFSQEEKKTKKLPREKKSRENPQEERYFPMLARKFDDEKKHIIYPAVIQPKLDGMRCVLFFNGHEIIMYSRNKKNIDGFQYIKDVLLTPLRKIYKKFGIIYIDGELYKHGMKLQEIVSISRNPAKNSIPLLSLYAFDCFSPRNLDQPYTERLEMLGSIVKFTNSEYLVLLETKIIENEEEANIEYRKFLKKKYEGAMIKNMNSPYLGHLTKSGTNLRSREVLKRKKRYDDEYKIVGFTDGNRGRDIGALIWILETPAGERFHATPKNMNIAERKNIYKQFNKGKLFDKYNGKMITVEYEDLSDDGIPLRAKAIIVRDYE